MDTKLNSNYTIGLKVRTPVHVGAGNEKNWQRGVDFVEAEGNIYVLQPSKMLSAMSEQLLRSYTQRLEQANFREAEKLLIDHLDLDLLADPIFEYDGGKIGSEIKTVARTGSGTPYIPGSSLKGAIISTIFHYLQAQAGPAKPNRFINNDLLGTFAQSIMHYIRPGDVLIPKTAVTNVSLFNLYPKGSDWESDYKDSFKITLEHFKPGAKGDFRLSVADGLGTVISEMERQQKKVLLPKYYDRVIQENPAKFLFKLINDCTREHLRREQQFFERYDDAEDSDLIVKEIKILSALTEKSEQSCLLRMAAGSGFHSITGDWRFKNHLAPLSQPDQENLTWSQRNRRREPSRYKSRKIMAAGDELLMGFVELHLAENAF